MTELRESVSLLVTRRSSEFSPYEPGTRPRPAYDRVDPYYFPIGGFQGVKRPGPLVRLYLFR